MTYALVIMLWYGSSGVATQHIPMQNFEACDFARRETLLMHDSARTGTVKAFCVGTN